MVVQAIIDHYLRQVAELKAEAAKLHGKLAVAKKSRRNSSLSPQKRASARQASSGQAQVETPARLPASVGAPVYVMNALRTCRV